MTAPTPYTPPDGHIVCLRRDVPAGWEYRYGSQTQWYLRSSAGSSNPSVFVEARPVRQPEPLWLVTDDFPDGRYVQLPITWTNGKGQLVGVTTVGEMRHRTDLDQWEYASSAWFGRWVAWEDFGGPEDFPVIVRRRVS